MTEEFKYESNSAEHVRDGGRDTPRGAVEAQKIGYAFPGQSSACYSADLLLRHYKRICDERTRMRRLSVSNG